MGNERAKWQQCSGAGIVPWQQGRPRSLDSARDDTRSGWPDREQARAGARERDPSFLGMTLKGGCDFEPGC